MCCAALKGLFIFMHTHLCLIYSSHFKVTCENPVSCESHRGLASCMLHHIKKQQHTRSKILICIFKSRISKNVHISVTWCHLGIIHSV